MGTFHLDMTEMQMVLFALEQQKPYADLSPELRAIGEDLEARFRECIRVERIRRD